jgi:hypothetical protein
MKLLQVHLSQYSSAVDDLKDYFIAKEISIEDSMFILAIMYATACKIQNVDRESTGTLAVMLYDSIIPSDEDEPNLDKTTLH